MAQLHFSNFCQIHLSQLLCPSSSSLVPPSSPAVMLSICFNSLSCEESRGWERGEGGMIQAPGMRGRAAAGRCTCSVAEKKQADGCTFNHGMWTCAHTHLSRTSNRSVCFWQPPLPNPPFPAIFFLFFQFPCSNFFFSVPTLSTLLYSVLDV